jgi:IS605 OrfB family transposase
MRLTIQCGIVKLTKFKQSVLDREYNNVQTVLSYKKEGLDWLINDVKLYSANKQNAIRYNSFSLRNDLINLKKAKSFWFLKIPVYGVRGGIRIPIKPHKEFPISFKLCESKIVRRNGKYIVMLTIEFDTPKLRKCSSVLAVDLGERFTATAVLLQDRNVMKVKFYGREIRGIRRHYSWLRKRLQERGLTKVVKRIGRKENHCVSDILHKVSTDIVSLADSSNSCIVLGDLKGIRKSTKGKGKRFNRIVNNMPYHKLTKMIQYKAEMLGIPVIQINEAYTSKTCHICGEIGKRKTQGLFFCKTCGEYNADLNGVINIGKRLTSYMLVSGAFCEQALNSVVLTKHHKSPEAPCVSVE